MPNVTHRIRWNALMALLDAAVLSAEDCGPEREAREAGDTSVDEYGGSEWSDLETKLATLYVHLGGDLNELSSAITQPWAQELQDSIRST